MTIEIIGAFTHRMSSDDAPAPLSQVDVPFLRSLVEAYDRNDYDRMLIANGAVWPDSIPFASYVAAITSRVGFMIAHRPGFVAPTMAARMLGQIDRLSGGRAAVHIITGANDAEMEADGDFLTKDVRYARSAEYAEILRRIWSADAPFDHEGKFYKFRRGFAEVKPERGTMPIYWGGTSPEAVDTAGRCADVFALGIDTLEATRTLVDSVRASAASYGRSIEFCLSTRVIVEDTEAEAWASADRILAGVVKSVELIIKQSMNTVDGKPMAVPPKLAKLLESGPVQDERLWIEITRATRGTRHGTSLVGDPEQVADAMMAYHDLGIRSFLMQGFDFRTDPDRFGASLIPLMRSKAAERDARAIPSAPEMAH